MKNVRRWIRGETVFLDAKEVREYTTRLRRKPLGGSCSCWSVEVRTVLVDQDPRNITVVRHEPWMAFTTRCELVMLQDTMEQYRLLGFMQKSSAVKDFTLTCSTCHQTLHDTMFPVSVVQAVSDWPAVVRAAFRVDPMTSYSRDDRVSFDSPECKSSERFDTWTTDLSKWAMKRLEWLNDMIRTTWTPEGMVEYETKSFSTHADEPNEYEAGVQKKWEALPPAERLAIQAGRDRNFACPKPQTAWIEDVALTPEERAFVFMHVTNNFHRRYHFMATWMVMSLQTIDAYEAWLERERQCLVHLSQTFAVEYGTASWCERHVVGTQARWRQFTLLPHPGGAVVSGWSSGERTWVGRIAVVLTAATAAASIVLGGTPTGAAGVVILGAAVADALVRMHKSRSLALRHTLSSLPWVTRLLQTVWTRVSAQDTWRRFGRVKPLTLFVGLSPFVSPDPPPARTVITNRPVVCPGSMDYRSFHHFCRAHQVSVGSKDAHNSNNMTDGGFMYIAGHAELLARAWLAERLAPGDANLNNWSQDKRKDADYKTSRFSVDIDYAAPAADEWLHATQQYAPSLDGWRVWHPVSGSERMLLSSGFSTQCMGLVLHDAVTDGCYATQTRSPVVISAHGFKVPGRAYSSYVTVWPDCELAVGDKQKHLAQFLQHRVEEVFGMTFNGTPIRSVIDLNPYNDSSSGGGSRFLFDDRRAEQICDTCRAESKEGRYRAHAWNCKTRKCRRIAQNRVKRPWAAIDVVTGRIKGEEDWGAFVANASVWSDRDMVRGARTVGAPPVIITPSVPGMLQTEYVWKRTDKGKAADIEKAAIHRSDPRVFAIEEAMRAVLGPLCQVHQLFANRRRGEVEIYRIHALMERGSSWCLNRNDPAASQYIHGDCQTFVNFYRGTYMINDYKCLRVGEMECDTSNVKYTLEPDLRMILFPDAPG